jgi:hypothetical protein
MRGGDDPARRGGGGDARPGADLGPADGGDDGGPRHLRTPARTAPAGGEVVLEVQGLTCGRRRSTGARSRA